MSKNDWSLHCDLCYNDTNDTGIILGQKYFLIEYFYIVTLIQTLLVLVSTIRQFCCIHTLNADLQTYTVRSNATLHSCWILSF